MGSRGDFCTVTLPGAHRARRASPRALWYQDEGKDQCLAMWSYIYDPDDDKRISYLAKASA